MNGEHEFKALIDSLADQVRDDARANFAAFEAQALAFKEQGSRFEARLEALMRGLSDQVREDALANFTAFRTQARAFKTQGSRLELTLRDLGSRLTGQADQLEALETRMNVLEGRVKSLEEKDPAA